MNETALICAHVRDGESNSPHTRAQRDTACGRRSLCGLRVAHLNRSQRREPGQMMETSYSVRKRQASIVIASRFATRLFDVIGMAFCQASHLRTSPKSLLARSAMLDPPFVSQSPHSGLFASWRLLPLPSTSIPRFLTLGHLSIFEAPTRAGPVPKSLCASLRMTPRELCVGAHLLTPLSYLSFYTVTQLQLSCRPESQFSILVLGGFIPVLVSS